MAEVCAIRDRHPPPAARADLQTHGPPYLPTTAGLGGQPTPAVDDPVCAVLLALFLAAAATNMTILQRNRRRGHKFLLSGVTFGFCMARTVALVLRVVWASRAHSLSVAIAAQVLAVAGVVLLFLVNLILAQRLVRALRPRLGWRPAARLLFRALFVSVPACICLVIPATIDFFYTRNPGVRAADRRIQLVATTWMALLAFLPVPLVLLARFAPPRPPHHGPVEPLGRGRLATQIALVLAASTLLSLGAGFRAGVNFAVRPRDHPAWFHSKPCYYCFNYVLELCVVYAYTLARFDRRFHVPDGASAPGHYARGVGGGTGHKSGSAGADSAGADSADPETAEERARAWDDKARDELRREQEGEPV